MVSAARLGQKGNQRIKMVKGGLITTKNIHSKPKVGAKLKARLTGPNVAKVGNKASGKGKFLLADSINRKGKVLIRTKAKTPVKQNVKAFNKIQAQPNQKVVKPFNKQQTFQPKQQQQQAFKPRQQQQQQGFKPRQQQQQQGFKPRQQQQQGFKPRQQQQQGFQPRQQQQQGFQPRQQQQQQQQQGFKPRQQQNVGLRQNRGFVNQNTNQQTRRVNTNLRQQPYQRQGGMRQQNQLNKPQMNGAQQR